MTEPLPEKKAKRESKLPVEVNEDEFIELMEATNKIHHKIAFLLAWESGLRISEVINLRPEHINENDKTVFILEGKGCKDRYTNLPKDWMPHLKNYIPIKCSIRALQASFMLYATKTGLKAKKPTVHFHSLRHGYATHCVRQGVKLPMLQIMLGHSDLATTSVYLLVNERRTKMKLPIKHEYFEEIKSGKKYKEFRDAHITFIDEETNEKITKKVSQCSVIEGKKEKERYPCLSKDEKIIRFYLE